MVSRIFILMVFIPSTLIAQIEVPKFSNEFLTLGVGAKGMAMANTQAALVDDVTAGYWNPAGLLHIEASYEVALMHSEYFAGIAKYDYLGFAAKIDSNSVLAFSLLRFGIDDIPDTRFLYDANGNINYNNIEFFAAADYAFLFSYARQLSSIKGLMVGANAKIIHRVAGDFANAWGFGIDVGTQYQSGKWSFGVMAKDLTGTFTAWYHNPELVYNVYALTGNTIPENSIELTLPRFIFGIVRELSLHQNFSLKTGIDLVTTFDGKRNVPIKSKVFSIDPSLGLEVNYKKLAFLRGGVGGFQKISEVDGSSSTSFQPNFGIGIIIKKVSVDYAMTDISNQSQAPYSHVFSLKFQLEATND